MAVPYNIIIGPANIKKIANNKANLDISGSQLNKTDDDILFFNPSATELKLVILLYADAKYNADIRNIKNIFIILLFIYIITIGFNLWF